MNEKSTHGAGKTPTPASGHKAADQPQSGAAKPKADPATKPAAHDDPQVLTEGHGGIEVVRFTVNGQVKSLNKPVYASELYAVAGHPSKLTVGGKELDPDDDEPVDLADDAEVTAEY